VLILFSSYLYISGISFGSFLGKKSRKLVYVSPNRDEYYMIAAGNSL
jgi:hypothetical protein